VLVFWGAWLLHAALAFSVPLFADEAYYVAWSQDLGLGYLDHPPGVAWWVSLGHPRLAGLTLLPAAWWLLADAARRLDVVAWAWLPALLMWTPLGVGAALVATPDAPLVTAWCVVVWAVVVQKPLLAGVAFGACLWAKSTALVALPGLVWVLGRQSAPMLVTAALVYAPHVAWSLANEGLPWSFQARRGLTGFHLHEALGGQVAVVTPGWFALAALAWWRPGDEVDRRLRALSLPILLVWFAASLVTRVEANWPALAWPVAALLVLRRGHRLVPASGGLAAGLTCLAGVVVWVAGPRTWAGPPRDGVRLRACLEAASTAASVEALVAARYHEKALLDLSGPPVGYLRARGHRPSEYDRRSLPAPPRCGFLYLGSGVDLAGRCQGEAMERQGCGRGVLECRCR